MRNQTKRNWLWEKLSENGIKSDEDLKSASEEEIKAICEVPIYDEDTFIRSLRHKSRLTQLLNTHLLLDQIALRYLEQNLQYPDAIQLHRWSLEKKVQLLAALGACSPYISEVIRQINSIRNRAAHEFGYKISPSDLKKIQEKFPNHLWDTVAKSAPFHATMYISASMFEEERRENAYWLLMRRKTFNWLRSELDNIQTD